MFGNLESLPQDRMPCVLPWLKSAFKARINLLSTRTNVPSC